MIAAVCFLAGVLLGAWTIHLVSTKRADVLSAAGKVDLQEKFSAKILGIVDGDTVQALTPGHLIYAVRLAGIDAPESAQPFGKQSTQHLSELIFGKTVNLECKNERDDYGRLVCKILLQPRFCRIPPFSARLSRSPGPCFTQIARTCADFEAIL